MPCERLPYFYKEKYYTTSKTQAETTLQEIMNHLLFYHYIVDMKDCLTSQTDLHFNALGNNLAMSQLADILHHKVFPTVTTSLSKRKSEESLQEIREILFFQTLPEDVKGIGLSIQEKWGCRSTSGTVMIEFQTMFPQHFSLTLEAQSFSQQNAPFTITIGDISQEFTLQDNKMTQKTLNFNNIPNDQSSVRITVPNPVSPKSLNYNSDERTLGIGIRSLRIEPFKDRQLR